MQMKQFTSNAYRGRKSSTTDSRNLRVQVYLPNVKAGSVSEGMQHLSWRKLLIDGHSYGAGHFGKVFNRATEKLKKK